MTVSVGAVVDPATLNHLLPEPFRPEEPHFIVEVQRLRNIGWLAGRGYNIVTVKIPASIESTDGVVSGDYTSVLWENRPEPIITGREELGFAKIFAGIDIDFEPPHHTVEAAASWDGHQFLGLRVDSLADASPAVMRSARPRFHYKYIPATAGWGEADVSCPVMTPPGDPHRVVEQVWSGRGQFGFTNGTFQQLPTMDYIVNKLAAVRVERFLPAYVSLSRGGKSLRDQTVIHTT